MPKWSLFLRECMKRSLTKAAIRDLPELRKVVRSDIKVEDLYELLSAKQPDLARLLVDAAPIYDLSALDLKIHILAVFDLRSDNEELLKVC